MNTEELLLLFVGSVIGAASGYLGSFMVIKRMSLVGDALSHVALPGIAISLTWGINPMLGAFVALVISTIGIWYLGQRTEIYSEALVGIFFTASLALGLLLTPDPELLEALFGDIDTITQVDSAIILLGSLIIFLVTKGISKQILLSVISEDLAHSQKINVSKINLTYLLLVALVVAIGVKFLGTLLTGAMIIIPAVIAKNIAGSIKTFQIYSIASGIAMSGVGILIAKSMAYPTGPIVVLVGVAMFLLSFVIKKK